MNLHDEEEDLQLVINTGPVGKAPLPDFLSKQKEDMYSRVSEFFRYAHEVSMHEDFRICTLPADTWRFERRYFVETSNYDARVLFTGFEQNNHVFNKGIRNAPWSSKEHPLVSGMREFEALGMEYYKTNRARYLRMNIHDAICATPALFDPNRVTSWGESHSDDSRPKPTAKEWRSRFFSKFMCWDAVWLDFNGCLSYPMIASLERIHRCVRYGNEIIPIVVTSAIGRESAEIGREIADAGGRKELIVKSLDNLSGYQFYLPHAPVEYVRDGGRTPMLNVFGYYEKLEH